MTPSVGRWLTGVALIALAPGPAFAQSAREAELEARLHQLESAVADLRAELDATRNAQQATAAQVAATQDQNQATAAKVAAIEAKPSSPADEFKVGSTSVKLGGYIKTVAMFSRWDDGDVSGNSLGRDFYLPQTIPIGGVRESTDNDFSAKQTRLTLSLDTGVAGHSLKGYLETDFQTAPGTQGSERTTNGYNLALRRAFVQFDALTVGQDWSTFQYVSALPESTDFVGVTEGTVFVRQPLIRYSAKLSPAATLHVSAENADTSSISRGATALVDNDDSRMPDLAARLNYAAGFGEVSIAGLARQLSVDNGAIGDRVFGWGASLAGKIPLTADKGSDLRFMATYGSGISRYVGLNFAPDVLLDPATGRIGTVETLAGFAALRIGLAQGLRTNLMASIQDVRYPDAPATAIAGLNQQAWSVAGNLFWSPVKSLDLGVELRHGNRRLENGAEGQLDRIEFAAKYGF